MRSTELLSALSPSTVTPDPPRPTRVQSMARVLRLLQLSAIVALTLGAAANAQQYKSIVVFGDSLSDTGDLAVTTSKICGIPIPGPLVDYTLGRATDGFDTVPAAHLFTGVWVEQLAAFLGRQPEVKPSLSGGTNYAVGYATNSNGVHSEVLSGLGMTCTVPIVDIGQQITSYLATSPKIKKQTLYIVWGGANDLIGATSPADVVRAASNDAVNIQRLIDAGATDFLIPNLPPLGNTPYFQGDPAQVAEANAASALYNYALAARLDVLEKANTSKDLDLFRLDTYALFQAVAASPGTYFLTNIDTAAQGLPVNPDSYLFWATVHPTTKGHNLLALAALKLVDPKLCASLPAQAQSPACASIP